MEAQFFKGCAKALAVILAVMMLLPVNGMVEDVWAADPQTRIEPDPVAYFVPEHRIMVRAGVTDPAGVSLVRCYFKAEEQADFMFVKMDGIGDDKYQGVLPAPSPYTRIIKYIFLAVNNNKGVVKTETFEMAKGDTQDLPEWQQVSSEGDIRVSTEIPEMNKPPEGFGDSITTDVAESSVRFGTSAGIYGATAVALSTTAIAAGAAVGVGAVTLAAEGGGSGGGGSSPSPVLEVSSTTPADGTEVTGGITNVQIHFSRQMANKGSVSITDDVTDDVRGVGIGHWEPSNIDSTTENWSDDGKTFHIRRANTSEALAPESEITFTLTGFEDTEGNQLSPYTMTITVEPGGVVVEW